MLRGKPINKSKAFAVGVVFFGSFGLVKLIQDARYMQKDLHKLSNIDLNERDLTKVQHKFKLSEKEMKYISEAQKKRRNETVPVNLIETDPNFQHKRTE